MLALQVLSTSPSFLCCPPCNFPKIICIYIYIFILDRTFVGPAGNAPLLGGALAQRGPGGDSTSIRNSAA